MLNEVPAKSGLFVMKQLDEESGAGEEVRGDCSKSQEGTCSHRSMGMQIKPAAGVK